MRHFEVELIGLRDLINEGVKDEKKKRLEQHI